MSAIGFLWFIATIVVVFGAILLLRLALDYMGDARTPEAHPAGSRSPHWSEHHHRSHFCIFSAAPHCILEHRRSRGCNHGQRTAGEENPKEESTDGG